MGARSREARAKILTTGEIPVHFSRCSTPRECLSFLFPSSVNRPSAEPCEAHGFAFASKPMGARSREARAKILTTGEIPVWVTQNASVLSIDLGYVVLLKSFKKRRTLRGVCAAFCYMTIKFFIIFYSVVCFLIFAMEEKILYVFIAYLMLTHQLCAELSVSAKGHMVFPFRRQIFRTVGK